MTFTELFRLPTPAGSPDSRPGLFPAVLAGCRHLHAWKPGGPLPAEGDRLLLAVGTWDGYAMRLLDAVEAAGPPLRVDVIDADALSAVEVAELLPVGRELPTPPFAGLWRDARFLAGNGGGAAYVLAAEWCGLPAGGHL